MLFRKRTTEQEFESEALPHLDAIYQTAFRLTGNAEEANDLVQEVYIQAWKSFHRYERGTNCRAWLFTILSNKFQHYRRKKYTQKVIPLTTETEFLMESMANVPPVPEQITDGDILDALGKLSDDYREVLLLADVQQFTYKEIAEITGIPIGTVMSRLSRGRKMLRMELTGVAREYGIETEQKKTRGASKGES